MTDKLYKGLIQKIDPIKLSRNSGTGYIRVYFKLKDDEGNYSWGKTDLVPTYMNYRSWEEYLTVGAVLDDLKLKSNLTVDADSKFRFVGYLNPENFNITDYKK